MQGSLLCSGIRNGEVRSRLEEAPDCIGMPATHGQAEWGAMLVIRGVMGTKKTIVFILLVVTMATLAGTLFGANFFR